MSSTVSTSLCSGRDVHDRRVDLQRHTRRDTVIDDGGDRRTLIVVGGFLFDQWTRTVTTSCIETLPRSSAFSSISAVMRVVEVLKEFVDGARGLHALIELIRIREQEALQALGVPLHALVEERVVVGIVRGGVHEVIVRARRFRPQACGRSAPSYSPRGW